MLGDTKTRGRQIAGAKYLNQASLHEYVMQMQINVDFVPGNRYISSFTNNQLTYTSIHIDASQDGCVRQDRFGISEHICI
jgi:hypothetical protein